MNSLQKLVKVSKYNDFVTKILNFSLSVQVQNLTRNDKKRRNLTFNDELEKTRELSPLCVACMFDILLCDLFFIMFLILFMPYDVPIVQRYERMDEVLS